jgi:hypothetical protein
MGRLFKALILLVLLGLVALAAYAYFGDMDPPLGEVTQPVTLDVD